MTTAAEYHATVARAQQDYEFAVYIDNTERMLHEQSEALATIRNTWITSAPPLPGCKVEYAPDGKGWRPKRGDSP